MADYKASASISVKRLRTGVTVTLSLVNTGGALFQTVNDDGTSIIPNWTTDEASRPILTPTASAGSSTAKISNGEWYYNSNLLEFDGDYSGDYRLTSDGVFGCNTETWALCIFKNLASADNYSNDTLEFRCTVTYDNVPYEMSRSVAVTIMKATTSSYYGFLYGDTTLTNEQQSGFLRAYLLGATGYVTGFTVRLYKNVVESDPWKTTTDTDKAGYLEWAIGVDDIDSSTLFIAQFLLDDTVVATAGLKVMDATDPLDLALTTEGNAELSDTNNVTVVAKLVDKDGVSGYPMKSITFTVLDNDLNEWRSVTNSGETTAAYFTVLFSDSVAGNDPVIVAVADYEI